MEELGGGLWGGVVAPLGSVYAGFLAMLLLYRRRGARNRRRAGRPARWPALLRYLTSTAVAGYLVFLAILVLFSFMFAEDREALGEGLTGGGALVIIGFIGLTLLGWVEGRWRYRLRGQAPAEREST